MTVAFVRQTESQSVAEKVIAELRRSIVFGALQPGQEFSLRETAALLGVSTAPVREALRVLQGEGLIVARRPRSAVVASMDAGDLRSIYKLRRLIEPEIAARSCVLLTPSDLDVLAEMVASFGDLDASMDQIYETHRQFHLALLQPAATTWDLRILETLWHASERYVRVGFGRLDPVPAEHRRRATAHHAILEAYRTGDAATARDAIASHLNENERIAKMAF